MYYSSIRLNQNQLEDFKTAAENGVEELSRLVNDWREEAYGEGFDDGHDEGEDHAYSRSEELADEWIQYGECDNAVEKRAFEIGMTWPGPNPTFYQDYMQATHLKLHPTGPFGYEYCAKCTK